MPTDAPFQRDAFAELVITTTVSFPDHYGSGNTGEFATINTQVENRLDGSNEGVGQMYRVRDLIEEGLSDKIIEGHLRRVLHHLRNKRKAAADGKG